MMLWEASGRRDFKQRTTDLEFVKDTTDKPERKEPVPLDSNPWYQPEVS